MDNIFNARSTTDEVLAGRDLSGMRVLLTGVSTGLGLETARAAAAHGAEVVGTARDMAKAAKALQSLEGISKGAIEVVELDLAALASVRACADALVKKNQGFDVIIGNAGVMASPFGKTEDGFETQFGTNHLGHFVLINRISSLIRSPGRVVMLSSGGHRIADVDLDDPNFEKTPYDPLIAYGRAKSANVLFAVEFDRRHRERGIRATAVHPGGIRTELLRHMTQETLQEMVKYSKKFAQASGAPTGLKTVQQGAATSVWAAFVARSTAIGGSYCEDCHVAEVVGASCAGTVSPSALDAKIAQALWLRSEEIIGEYFPLKQ